MGTVPSDTVRCLHELSPSTLRFISQSSFLIFLPFSPVDFILLKCYTNIVNVFIKKRKHAETH